MESLERETAALRERLARESAAAQAREQTLRAVLDAAPGAVVLLDEIGRIVFANSGARELFFEGREPGSENFFTLLAGAPEPLRKALLVDADHVFSLSVDGQTESYHLARRQLDLDGQPHNLLVLRNMTLEVSRQETAVLKKAIRVIHHELANSLTPVITLVQVVRQQIAELEKGAALVEMLAVVEERLWRLEGFLTGFASLGRLPRPRQREVGWEAFLAGLRPLLADIVVGAAPAGSGWMDETQIQQIVLNLVKNAREAGSPPSEIALEVAAAPEGGHRVSVLDRGEGMTDGVLENALVPSFTTKPKGSGMGLALCREIVDAHQGTLRIARRPGGGMAISFWLPPREPLPASATLNRARLTLSRASFAERSDRTP
jgi:two-component system, NtrC family, nitrogen regulation sensor histidine kinase NtrY